jgi:hypothetical protein
MPISGYGIIQKERFVEIPDVLPTETTEENNNTTPPEVEYISVIKYADKVNGNIYQTFSDKIDERKFSETFIPSVYESFFTKNSIIVRYLNDQIIRTFIGDIPEDKLGADMSDGNEIFGDFLPENIKDISVSSNGNKMFYLTNSTNGVNGIMASSNGKEKKQIFSSAFSEWTSSWVGEDQITLTTKPSGFVPGYAYLLDISSTNYEKIIGNILGLTTLMNNFGDLMAYTDQNLNLRIFDLNQNISKELRLRTHSEKCVWAKNNTTLYCAIPKEIPNGLIYPDIWYQGEVSYDDEIFRINTETGQRTKLSNLSLESGELVDAIYLKLDETEENLFFMNKKDSYLWRLELN